MQNTQEISQESHATGSGVIHGPAVQHALLALMGRILQRGRVAHAYLFSGGGVSTRSAAAFFFARLLLCSRPQETCGLLTPCGVCIHCRKTAHGTHPDLFVCQSEEDGAIRIEHVRAIQKAVAFAPLEAERRVCLVHGCENMTPDAANSLLKLLEEPPASNHLFLTVSAVETLLPTIVSRCQILKCLSDPLTMDCFSPEEQAVLRIYPLQFWERLCAGDSEVVRGLLNLNFISVRDRFWRLMARKADISMFFQLTRELSESDAGVLCLKLLLMSVVLDIFLLKSGGDGLSLLLNQDRGQDLMAISGSISMPELEQYSERLERVEYLLERNINKALLVESMLAFWLERLSL
ncbi:MAG: hypothetical protein PHC35_01580 [Deltaproteobacteria bacterium]|jgi:DNA polymerase-3 subunit delta'|nr:hypothetical protein [Deltaproteobacteria bacterium]